MSLGSQSTGPANMSFLSRTQMATAKLPLPSFTDLSVPIVASPSLSADSQLWRLSHRLAVWIESAYSCPLDADK
eukprot:3875642-Ditylum_brightwellii.AAC.1